MLIFFIGIDSLLKCIVSPAEGYLFAGDLVVLVERSNITPMENILNSTLRNIEKWSTETG